jgi:3-methyladenine DNA glycosylase AlkD
MNFIESLESVFEQNKNAENGFAMAKYMRNNFLFYGLKTELRRQIFKNKCKEYDQELSENSRAIALALFNKPQRELHYCAIEILIKKLKGNYKIDDIELIRKFLTNNSWWDSVDTISKYILGEYLMCFPEETKSVVMKFSNDKNMWLNRSAILFQLGYKHKTNFDLLISSCEKHKNSDEFFIQKAIGWSLREYAKIDPIAVKNYVFETNLKPLSIKEALKNIV